VLDISLKFLDDSYISFQDIGPTRKRSLLAYAGGAHKKTVFVV